MKNKYQEALARIENDDYDFPNDFYGEDKATVRERDLDWIEELVDKETPMKKTIKNDRPYCAKCSYSLLIEDVWEMSYCCACGQKIDWGIENVKT